MPPSLPTLAQPLLHPRSDRSSLDRAIERLGGGGPGGQSVIRGLFIGVALGIVLALLCCCWWPCLRRRRTADSRALGAAAAAAASRRPRVADGRGAGTLETQAGGAMMMTPAVAAVAGSSRATTRQQLQPHEG